MHDIALQNGQKFVLIGDSITDCGRLADFAPYGNGYVSILRDLVIAGWPERDLTWVNKGIGGHNVVHLSQRWEEDVLAEKPDWLSIKIGINDLYSYMIDPATGIALDTFRQTYEEILTQANTRIHPQLILITPLYIYTDRTSDTHDARMLCNLPDYIAVVEEMAAKFNARLVRLQPVFEHHLSLRPPATFCPEPVHPNHTGHVIIAKEVLKALMK
jgi:lysophospholipase L1-like esterase